MGFKAFWDTVLSIRSDTVIVKDKHFSMRKGRVLFPFLGFL